MNNEIEKTHTNCWDRICECIACHFYIQFIFFDNTFGLTQPNLNYDRIIVGVLFLLHFYLLLNFVVLSFWIFRLLSLCLWSWILDQRWCDGIFITMRKCYDLTCVKIKRKKKYRIFCTSTYFIDQCYWLLVLYECVTTCNIELIVYQLLTQTRYKQKNHCITKPCKINRKSAVRWWRWKEDWKTKHITRKYKMQEYAYNHIGREYELKLMTKV